MNSQNATNREPNESVVDHYPYPLHTNRELEFMLERNKPLAHFSDAYDEEPKEEVFPEISFQPYVASGRFVMRDFVIPDASLANERFPDARGIRHLFYAQAHEAWRIDAFIFMLWAWQKASWSDGFERLEGSLLGYSEWEIDRHMELRQRRLTAVKAAQRPTNY
jgi:hypothetical protein